MRVDAAYDLFHDVSFMYFLYNIHQSHYVVIQVCPARLHQSYIDGMHGHINKNIEHLHVSKCLHNWLIEYYKATKGVDHPNKCEWSLDLVTDNSNIIGNPLQAGVDCALHSCFIPVMLQDGIPLHVLGHSSDKSGREMRIRMALSIIKKQWFFITDESKRLELSQLQSATKRRLIQDLNMKVQSPTKRIKKKKK